MHDDKLPVGPTGNDAGLPAKRDSALPVPRRQSALSVEMLADEGRDDRDEIDLLAYWRILLKRRWLILGVLAGVLAISLLLSMLLQKIGVRRFVS